MKKGSIFCFIFFILLFISLAFYLTTGTTSQITLTGLLNFFSTEMSSIDISWSLVDLTIVGDWGIFEFLRNFLNWFTTIIEVSISLFGMIYRVLVFSFRFVTGLLFP